MFIFCLQESTLHFIYIVQWISDVRKNNLNFEKETIPIDRFPAVPDDQGSSGRIANSCGCFLRLASRQHWAVSVMREWLENSAVKLLLFQEGEEFRVHKLFIDYFRMYCGTSGILWRNLPCVYERTEFDRGCGGVCLSGPSGFFFFFFFFF
jgi:hypothetical protein